MTSPNSNAWNDHLLSQLDWLRSIVSARLGEPQAVDDVLSEVMSDALAIDNPQAIKQPAPWLYRLAVRKTLLFRRSCGRRRRLEQNAQQQFAAESREANYSTPLELMLQAERDEVVRQALQRLQGRDVEVLLLKYVHEWDYRQISEKLGLDYWKVVHRLRKAREHLRRELQGTPIEV